MRYQDLINNSFNEEEIEKMNEIILSEKMNPKVDKKKIMQLEERKLLGDIFANNFGYSAKFRNPW